MEDVNKKTEYVLTGQITIYADDLRELEKRFINISDKQIRDLFRITNQIPPNRCRDCNNIIKRKLFRCEACFNIWVNRRTNILTYGRYNQ